MKEYLAKLLKALAAKNLELQGHMTKSLDGGSTPDEATEASIQAIEKEIEAIEKNIARVQKQVAETAKAVANGLTPVAGQTAQEAMDTANGNPVTPKVEVVKTLPKGVGYAMAVKATALAAKNNAKGIQTDALQVLKHWGAPQEVQDVIIAKAIVGTTTDANFASALANQEVLTNEFIELLRPKRDCSEFCVST